jgi:hypothetical protein
MLSRMTRIPWPTLSGDDAEGLIALLLFSEYPVGAQRITPSQGDGGMDVRIWTPDGWDVYQIKKFYQALDASQKAKVEGSFRAFVDEVAREDMAVKGWTVVMPWDPTREARKAFNKLTEDAPFPTNWEGLTFLERLASNHPAAVDYFIGNGQDRVFGLIEMAMRIGTPLASGQPEASLTPAALTKAEESFAKVREIENLLGEVDPYYKYTFTLEQAPDPANGLTDFSQPANVVYAKYRFFDDKRCLVIRAFPRTEGMSQLRPIRLHYHLEPREGTPEVKAVEEFFQHGTEITDIPGAVSVLDDPTGLVESDQSAQLISFVTQANPELPELEARLFNSQGTLLHRVPLVKAAPSVGQVEGGFSIKAEDAGGVFTLVAKGNRATGRYGFNISLQDLSGKTPVRALPALRLLSELAPGNCLSLAIQGAGEAGPRVTIEDEALITQRASDLIEFAKALLIFQLYTSSRVVFPDFGQLTSDLLAEVGRVVDLLLGKVLKFKWANVSITAAAARELRAVTPPPNSALIQVNPLVIDLGNYELALDVEEQLIWPTPICAISGEELQALPDDASVELVPQGDSTLYRRLPVEHVPRVIEID